MFDQERLQLHADITRICAEAGLPEPDLQWQPVPFSGEWGISTSFFKLAAQEARLGQNATGAPVPVRAQEIAAAVAEGLAGSAAFNRIEAQRGYLNLYFSTAQYSEQVLRTVQSQGASFGYAAANNDTVMVEYSQPNTHKALHVGHLRNMILGAAICNILDAAGYEVIRANYPGDTGLHVIKWLWNYLKNHKDEEPPEDKIRWLGDIYAEANRLLEADPDLEVEIRALFQKWDVRDPELVALWEQTRAWSIEGFNIAYDAMGVRFDRYYWQSDLDDAGKAIVRELIDAGIADDERPDGPVIVKIDEKLGLDQEKYRVMIALRSDNTALYPTWDLALAIKKFEDYNLAKSIYVVDVRQSLHLQQVFKTLELMDKPWTDKIHHLPYEIVNLPGNITMKSREGTIVLLEDLLREAHKRALEEVEARNPDLEQHEKDNVARAVSIGAIKYPLLARDNNKIATFDWEVALDFDGHSAPYIQYAHVRANSILRRFGAELPALVAPIHELTPPEIQLVDLLSRMPDEVLRAAEEYKTLHITNLLYDLARGFTSFYSQCPVLNQEPAIRDFRLNLVDAARQALANLLGILGIEAPEVM
jgi:arginyl-tRNA synthetase